MGYTGPIECPNCKCPISRGTKTCPYCYARIPLSAPWNNGSLGIWVAVLAVVVFAISSDHYFGTQVVETVRDFCSKSFNQ